MTTDGDSVKPPPRWNSFVARLGQLSDPHSVRGAHIEYLATLFADCRVEYSPPELDVLASNPARWLADTEPFRIEGLPLSGPCALLDEMVLVSGPAEQFETPRRAWLSQTRQAVERRLREVEEGPPDPDEHPVTRLGREPLLHQCVQSLAGQSEGAFHGLFLSIDGFPSRWPAGARTRSAEGDDFLRQVATLLRHSHPPRAAIFHLSHAFFAVLCMGPTRREYRKSMWDLRNRILRRGCLPHVRLRVSMAVTFWPSDARDPEAFLDRLMRSLEKAWRQGGNAVVFTTDWNDFR